MTSNPNEAAGKFWIVNLNQGEAPAIGHGHRIIFVHKIGHKWINIADPSLLNTCRIDVRTWNAIAKSARPVRVRKRVVRQAMRYVKSEKVRIRKNGAAETIKMRPTKAQKSAHAAMLAACGSVTP